MNRLAYAIARDRPDLPRLGETARLIFDGLAIVHGPAPKDALSPGLECLQAYASTVSALHERETVLPFRFGSLHETEAELESVLRVRPDEWREQLDEVEECEEMGLRVLLNGRQVAPIAVGPTLPISGSAIKPGLAYLASRRADLAGRDALQGEAARIEALVVETFGGLSRQRIAEGPRPGRENLLSFTFLVPRSNLDAFRRATQVLVDRDLVKLLPTGPWPPYHFASPQPPP